MKILAVTFSLSCREKHEVVKVLWVGVGGGEGGADPRLITVA